MAEIAEMTSTQSTEEFAERLFGDFIRGAESMMVYLGDRLGLYGVLADGPLTAPELARAAGIHPRYAREWLEQQAVAEVLAVDDPDADPDERHYGLPAAYAPVLTDPDSLAYLAPLSRFLPAFGRVAPALVEAFRTGGGVPWVDYGADAREAQADLNRPHYLQLLGTDWLPQVADVHRRLEADPPARVADIACGAGWSSIAIALAYPTVRVDGFDLDEASIDLARANARKAGVADRVRFAVRDAADPDLAGAYDLVTIFEAVHDLPQPVEALTSARRLASESGAVVVMDERTAESLSIGDPLERFFYVASVALCLPTGLADEPSAGTGTVMRAETFRRYALEAGFRDVEVLPIEHDFFRFYRPRS